VEGAGLQTWKGSKAPYLHWIWRFGVSQAFSRTLEGALPWPGASVRHGGTGGRRALSESAGGRQDVGMWGSAKMTRSSHCEDFEAADGGFGPDDEHRIGGDDDCEIDDDEDDRTRTPADERVLGRHPKFDHGTMVQTPHLTNDSGDGQGEMMPDNDSDDDDRINY
ncbi:hypothetical protein THAOC_08923, partial [Thalassiosira oceanica]